MKKYYKLLDDIANHQAISQSVYDYIVNHTDIVAGGKFVNVLDINTVYHHVPELATAIADLGLEAFQILILQTIPNDWYDGRVHVDVGNAADGARMIWPVHNCEGSQTRFFDVDQQYWEERLSQDESSYAIFMTVPPPYQQVDYYELTVPGIIDTQTPHGIFCNPNIKEPRLSMSLTFRVAPDHLLK
jgi:hypothetical protein